MRRLVLSMRVRDVEWEVFLLITETSSASVTTSYSQLEVRDYHTRSGKTLPVVVYHKDHRGFLVWKLLFFYYFFPPNPTIHVDSKSS